MQRIASVKTEGTAWKLVERIAAACPFNTFVLIRRAPDAPFEIHPAEGFHAIDEQIAKKVVAAFLAEAKQQS